MNQVEKVVEGSVAHKLHDGIGCLPMSGQPTHMNYIKCHVIPHQKEGANWKDAHNL